MTARDRVLAALSHESTDRVPWNIELTSEEERKVRAALDSVATEAGSSCHRGPGLGRPGLAGPGRVGPGRVGTGADFSWFDEYAGNHIDKATYNIGGSHIEAGVFRDEYGVVWDRRGLDKDIGVVRGLVFPEPDFADYSFSLPDPEAIGTATLAMLERKDGRFKLGKIGLAYFERAWSLRGMENLLMDFYLNPEFAEALFAKVLEHNLAILDVALRYDIDGVYFGDDYGQQTGMIMGPPLWRRFIKPGLAAMFAKVKEAGKIVALHSCGDISEIYGDLIEIGLDVHQTFQPEIYDIGKIKREYGKRLSFWGGISTQHMLPFLSPTELIAATRELVELMSVGGGFIAAPTHRVPADVPAENIIALVDYFHGR